MEWQAQAFASTPAILPRKANGPAIMLGHSVDDQARRAPDNAGPLNFHSPTQKRAGRYPGNVFRLHPISLTGRAVCGHIPAFSGRDIYRADPLACHRFPTPPLLCWSLGLHHGACRGFHSLPLRTRSAFVGDWNRTSKGLSPHGFKCNPQPWSLPRLM